MTTQVIKGHFVVKHDERFHESVFPSVKKAVLNGEAIAAVPDTLDHAHALQAMGYPVTSPILRDYAWKGRFKPFNHQYATSDFCTMNRRGFILNDMRTGKTLSALWATDYLMDEGSCGKVLICSPLSTLERVWGDAIFSNFPHRTFNVLYGSRAKRMELLAQDKDFYVINHHGIHIIKDILATRPDINWVIIDELAVFRNKGTNLWRSMNEICNQQHPRAVWGMTGTPTPNEPTDAYGQSKLVKPENYTGSFTRFKNLTMLQLTQFKWIPRRNINTVINGIKVNSAEEAAHAILTPNIRFERSVVSSMTPCFIERSAELSSAQQKHYNELLRSAFTTANENTITAVNSAVLAGKLTQAACGMLYSDGGEVEEIDFGPRLKVLSELIEQNNEKVLVFSTYKGMNRILKRELSKKYSVEIIDGDVAPTKRNKIFQDFMIRKDPHVIVAHPQTMAHGLDLTAASLIIWYCPPTSNEHFNQAVARIDGTNQKVKQDVAMISATKEERAIYAGLRNKTRMQDIVLRLAKNFK